MKKQISYVECKACIHNMDDPDYDWVKHPCKRCSNTRKVQDPATILCNMCGGCMCFPEERAGAHNSQIPSGLHEQMVSGHYDSEHLTDTMTYTFSMCEECLRKLFRQFKTPPEMGTYFSGEPHTWEEDEAYYEFRLWREAGGQHDAYMAGKCNAVKNCPGNALYTVLFSGVFTEYTCCEEHKDHYKNTMNATLSRFIQDDLKPFL